MKKKVSKEQLMRILIIVSIIVIAIIGLNYLGELASGFISTIGQAARSVITPFAIAFLLSFLIAPLARIIEDKTGIKRNISIMIAIAIGIIFVLGILSITLTFIITQLITVIAKLIDVLDNETIKSFFESIVALVERRIDFSSFDSIVSDFDEYGLTPDLIINSFGSIVSGIRSVASSVVSVGFTIILTPVFMYYLVKDKEQIFGGMLYVFPKESQKHVKSLALGSDKVIRGYFIGHGMVMAFITVFFTITYILLSFFIPGFNILHAILFALIMGVFSIVPYLGVWISMAMPIALFLTLNFEATDPGYIYFVGIAMIFVLNIVEEILESTLVQPKVFSKQVKIHPIAVLSSFIFFGAVFGLVGFILAVPIAGTLKVAIRYFKELNNEDKKTETKETKEDNELTLEDKESKDKNIKSNTTGKNNKKK